MSNVFGKNLTLTLFGESHGPMIGGTLDGLPSGIEVSESSIASALSKRRPAFPGETSRVEKDDFEIVSGVYQGKTTGEPLTILIKNENIRSSDYAAMNGAYRPNHADFAAHEKYGGFEDPRGGGHFSGRITAAVVALGAIVESFLSGKGIQIGAHVASVGPIQDQHFNPIDPSKEIESLNGKPFPTLDDGCSAAMQAVMKETVAAGDSIGGSVEIAVIGVPCGIGEPWFDRLDGALASACFSIGGVRGIRFGDIPDIERKKGSEFNDPFAAENGRIVTKTNHSGGLQGGISNGMPIIFTAIVKPTPSISLEQDTLNRNGESVRLSVPGRHDPCIVRRIVPVLKAMAALTIADLYLAAYGRAR